MNIKVKKKRRKKPEADPEAERWYKASKELKVTKRLKKAKRKAKPDGVSPTKELALSTPEPRSYDCLRFCLRHDKLMPTRVRARISPRNPDKIWISFDCVDCDKAKSKAFHDKKRAAKAEKKAKEVE